VNAAGFKDQIRLGGLGQVLTFESRQGRPSAASVTLYDSRHPRSDPARNPILPNSPATLTAVDTTMTAPSGASQDNPRRVFCTPPMALGPGDFVLLTNASMQTERSRIVAIAPGASFDVDHDLAFDYAAGATVRSAVMTSPAIPTSFVSDPVNLGEDYEAVWSYTVGGTAFVETTRWDLVREALEDGIPDSYLFDRFPDLSRFQFRSQPGSFQPQVRAAQRDVDALLRACNLKPHRLRGNELVRHLVELRALVIIADNAIKPAGSEAEAYFTRRLDEWERQENLLLGGQLKIPYDANEDGVVNDAEREGVVVLDFIR
jgi:hypothetical protein